ncbi:MAG: DNA adenine methylase [Rhodoglobus sp.]
MTIAEGSAHDAHVLFNRASSTLSSEPRPFLRWAGSKQRLLSQLLPHMPSQFGAYFEPFLGAGALFFLLEPGRAHLSDLCAPLVEVYEVVARDPEAVYSQLSDMNILDKDLYYRVRAERPTSEIRRAARFVYLNRAGWNGLYRVNNKGVFNVPYGRPATSNTIDFSNLMACSAALARDSVTIGVDDFSTIEDKAVAGDFVYFDPPYVTGHNNNGFIDYNENLFSWSDQVRLASLARRLQENSVHVVVSNAHHEAVLALYPTFRVAEVSRRSTLASSIKSRKAVAEAVFY